MRLRDCLGKTRLELDKNSKLIKGMTPAPVGISVWQDYQISLGELVLAKAEVPQTERKLVPGRITDSKRKEYPVEATISSQTVAASTLAPARKEGSESLTKCFRCGKLGHFAQNCKSKDAVAAMVPDNLGKGGDQSM